MSFQWRQEAVSTNRLFFSFRLWRMARIFPVRRWGEQIGIPDFLQFKPRIHDRIRARTRQRDGGVHTYRCHLGVARDLHGSDRHKIAEQGSAITESPLNQREHIDLVRAYRFGQRNSSRYSGVSSGAKPWRVMFSVTTRGNRNCRR